MTCGDLSAIELCVEDWKQKQQQHQGWKEQATTRLAASQDSGKQGGGGGVEGDGGVPSNGGEKGASDSVVDAPDGLELNSSAYKPDADPSSSQANNMAVAFELNL